MVMEAENEEDGKRKRVRGSKAVLSKEKAFQEEDDFTESKYRSCSDPLPPSSAEQRMSSFRFIYLGNAVLDRRYTQAMLPWVISEVKRKKNQQEINLIVESMTVKAEDFTTGDVIFQHKVQTITRCARSADKKYFAYLTKSPQDASSCFCYVFETSDQLSVPGFLQSIKQAAKHDISQKNVDSSKTEEPNSQTRFNQTTTNQTADSVSYSLWYVGRLVVSHRQAPPTLIDDSVERFSNLNKRLDLERQLKAQKCGSGGNRHRTEQIQIEPPHMLQKKEKDNLVIKANSVDDGLTVHEEGRERSISSENRISVKLDFESRPRSASDGDKANEWLDTGKKANSVLTPQTHRRTASFGSEVTRNVIFRITPQCVTIINDVTKTTLMEKKLREISFCQQGTKAPEHFGFICRDSRTNQYNCYVFKGASEPLVDNVMKSLKQAFHIAWQTTGPTSVCELCPLHSLHQLCTQLEGLSTVQQHDCLKKQLVNFSEAEMNEFTERYKAESPLSDVSEENDVIMAILRGLYEKRQQGHSHELISPSSRDMKQSPNLLQKAKKTLANSFESFRSKRAKSKTSFRGDSIEEANENAQVGDPGKPSPSPKKRSHTFSFETVQSPTKSTTPPMSPITERTHSNHETTAGTQGLPRSKPPLKEKTSSSSLSDDAFSSTPPDTPSKPTSQHSRKHRQNQSYRQHIFHSVVTPSKRDSVSSVSHELNSRSWTEMCCRKRTGSELRALWRKAIMEQILLIRMEKENKSLQVHQDAVEFKHLKLDYEEQFPCSEEAEEKWNELLKCSGKVEKSELKEAVKAGVPKLKRGEVWQFLIKQYHLNNPDQPLPQWYGESSNCYESVKDAPTSHQHSIFIDLGRTFPSHPYFAIPLGQGQKALFNLLKGYSVLDHEVGYCQGLSFVAGMLLMHLEEKDTFDALCHILFILGIRKQYKPTMQELQVQFYMLTRLLHDYHESLYDHLEELEVTPTLYAAPWFLTLFASHFPIGFVARVLDMIFLEGIQVIFKVILCLMGKYKNTILECEGFEEVVDFTKSVLPTLAVQNTDSVVAEVLATNITKNIESYEIEYVVLNEEAVSIQSFEEAQKIRIQELEAENLTLRKQVETLSEQLSSARNSIHSLESSISTMQMNQEDLLAIIRSVTCERDCLQKEMEQFAKHKVNSSSFDDGSGAPGKLTDTSGSSGDSLRFRQNLGKSTTEASDSSTDCGNNMKETNTSPSLTDDSFEHIDSDEATDEEVVSLGRNSRANLLTVQGRGATSPELSNKAEDLAVSR